MIHGLRPPALDELGWWGVRDRARSSCAGRRCAGTALSWWSRHRELPPLPAAVEVALPHRRGGVTNVALHAHAHTAPFGWR